MIKCLASSQNLDMQVLDYSKYQIKSLPAEPNGHDRRSDTNEINKTLKYSENLKLF